LKYLIDVCAQLAAELSELNREGVSAAWKKGESTDCLFILRLGKAAGKTSCHFLLWIQ